MPRGAIRLALVLADGLFAAYSCAVALHWRRVIGGDAPLSTLVTLPLLGSGRAGADWVARAMVGAVFLSAVLLAPLMLRWMRKDTVATYSRRWTRWSCCGVLYTVAVAHGGALLFEPIHVLCTANASAFSHGPWIRRALTALLTGTQLVLVNVPIIVLSGAVLGVTNGVLVLRFLSTAGETEVTAGGS